MDDVRLIFLNKQVDALEKKGKERKKGKYKF